MKNTRMLFSLFIDSKVKYIRFDREEKRFSVDSGIVTGVYPVVAGCDVRQYVIVLPCWWISCLFT